jgi:hypothetical protein
VIRLAAGKLMRDAAIALFGAGVALALLALRIERG